MAQLPCTACQRRHPMQRNAGVYCHLWNNGIQHDFRLRLCPRHLTMFQDNLAKYELVSVDDTTSIIATPSQCFACSKPTLETDWHFSITAYPAKDQRKDYWTRLHVDCEIPEWGKNGQPLS